ncbi:MAG: metal-dependent hydrolase [Desulfurococcaceae archaeon]
MRRRAHEAMGFAVGFIVGSTTIDCLILGVFGALGALVPDLDIGLMHRKLLHNLVMPTLVLTILYAFLLGRGPLPSALGAALSFYLGWVSHVLADALTVAGVSIAFPISRRRVAAKLFKSGDRLGDALLYSLALLATSTKIYLLLGAGTLSLSPPF